MEFGLTLLPTKGVIIDYINLVEKPLPEIIKKLREEKATVRLQGLLILAGRSCEIYVDLKEGEPVLAILIEKEVTLKGDLAWQEINVTMRNSAGFLEIYKLTPKEVEEDLKLVEDAKIQRETPIEVVLPEVHPKIEEYSKKLASTIMYKTAIIVNSVHLNARAERAATTASLSAVIANEITASEDTSRYISATLYGSEKWKTIEVLAKNKVVLAAVAEKVDGTIHGTTALKIMLSPELLGKYSSFDILIYDVKIDPIQILEGEKIITRAEEKIAPPTLQPKTIVKPKPLKLKEMKPAEVVEEVKEKVEVDIEEVKAKAEEYFGDVLDTLGYEIKDMTVNLVEDTIKFNVKIKKKRFTLRSANLKKVRRSLLDEARWIAQELKMRVPVEVEVEKE